ncbi:hypothetical protein CN899_29765, partial [Bacillus thuringiensis]
MIIDRRRERRQIGNAWRRPRIKIKKSKSEWMWDFIGYSCFFASILFIIALWGRLPEEVPVH